jgi:uncharacterized protein
MKEILIRKMKPEEIKTQGIETWPVWEKEISEFEWYYDNTEYCYILEGRFIVYAAGKAYTCAAGDFITFPAGISCVWKIMEPVRKHYRFEE